MIFTLHDCRSHANGFAGLPHGCDKQFNRFERLSHGCGKQSTTFFSLSQRCGRPANTFESLLHSCGKLSNTFFSLLHGCGKLSNKFERLSHGCGKPSHQLLMGVWSWSLLRQAGVCKASGSKPLMAQTPPQRSGAEGQAKVFRVARFLIAHLSNRRLKIDAPEEPAFVAGSLRLRAGRFKPIRNPLDQMPSLKQ
jgi:hypothetical protein